MITVSDQLRRGNDHYDVGPQIVEILQNANYYISCTTFVSEELDLVKASKIIIKDYNPVNLIVTRGGAGIAPRGMTTKEKFAICDKLAPGLREPMRYAFLRTSPLVMLSRGNDDICNATLIINLPEYSKGEKDNLEAVIPALKRSLINLQSQPADWGILKELSHTVMIGK